MNGVSAAVTATGPAVQLGTWRALWRLMTFDAPLYALNLLMWGLMHSLPLVNGLILRAFFDALSGSAPAGGLDDPWTLLALLVAVSLGRVADQVYGVWVWAALFFTAQGLLRRNLLRWIVKETGQRSLLDSAGEAVTRFRDDVDELVRYLEHYVDGGGIVLYVILAVGVMVAIDARLTAITLAPLLVIVLLTQRMSGRIRRYRRATREATGVVTGFIGETFGAVLAVKVGRAERHVIHRFDQLNEKRRRAALKDTLFSELLRSINWNIANVGTGVVLLAVNRAVRDGSFSVGDLALFISYLPRTTQFVYWISEIIAQHRRSGLAIERMQTLLKGAPREELVKDGSLHLSGALPEVPYVPKTAVHRL